MQLKLFKMQSFKGKPQNKVDDLSWYNFLSNVFYVSIWKICICAENKVQFNVQNSLSRFYVNVKMEAGCTYICMTCKIYLEYQC